MFQMLHTDHKTMKLQFKKKKKTEREERSNVGSNARLFYRYKNTRLASIERRLELSRLP